MSAFEPRVEAVLRALAPGEVVTYGEVAAEAGFPGAARAVGNLLRTSTEGLPWWRVVAASGRLAPGHEVEHAKRLRAEGVSVVDGRVRRAPRRRGAATPRPPTARTRDR
ncbi:MAG: methylated-DNA-protein-cysteine methyltransferase related protein [Actinomycetota bacterium]|nr:methylated-DNA-protein-cysteine methyltransferase related protein [Actinomycetota bacterium]